MSGCREFIGRLNPAGREKDVEKFFKGYGRIRDTDLKRGFDFVEFEDPWDADDAVYELDEELGSERVTIEHAQAWLEEEDGRGQYSDTFSSRRPRNDRRKAPPVRKENQLIVENLSSRVSRQDHKDFMRQTGEVTFADSHLPKLNEGIVEFASYGDLKNAIEKLSGKEINRRKIKLIEDSKRHSRSRTRSGSRTRSSSRSRSQSRSRRSKSYSQSRSRSWSRSKSRSGSRSPVPEKSQKPVSSSRSKSPASVNRHRSQSRSRSRSVDSGN